MVRLSADVTLMDTWKDYHNSGLTIFPLKKGGKNPGTDFGIRWQQDWVQKGKPTYPELATTFESGTYGLWLATGQISKRVVLDLDSPQAEAYWRERIGEATFNRSLKVSTGRGRHLHFFIRPDDDRPWPGHSDEQIGFDFRGDGGGVVMPPSVHKSGRVYEWADGELLEAPECLRKEAQPRVIAARDGGTNTGGNGTTLAGELMLPPGDPGRGNNWLARVAGFEAKAERKFYDRYVARMMNYNWASVDPIDEGDFMKTIESIWNSEHDKTEQPSQENGWLVGDGARMFTHCEVGNGDDKKRILGEWADFDVRVLSITRATDGTIVYTINLFTDGHTYESIQLDPAIFSSDSKMTQWLGIRGATILPQQGDKYANLPHRHRLAKYLKAQDAASSNAVHHLGWNSDLGQFIAHEGIISSAGIQSHTGSVPDPVLISWAPYVYGVVSEAEALEVLREVLTYQDETVTSVFGAWWVMAILKGRYVVSQFPFMSIEAPSESGKTNGFFAFMVALAGNTNGHGRYTAPAFRDALAGHRNGMTWLDDVTEITDLQDTIRQLTAEGHASKKGDDRRQNETIKLLCPLVVSGEGLGSVMSEKAMRDRAIQLEVSSPKGRMSYKDPTRAQWDDIQEMLTRYSDDGKPEHMSKVAGTLVSLVHQRADMLSELKAMKSGGGRHGEKVGIIRMGARILADMLDDPTIIERVDRWCEGQEDEGAINYAIGEIIPWYLRNNLIPTSATGHVPAYYDQRADTVWVSPARLADAWRSRANLSGREKQLGTEDAIRAEFKANNIDLLGKPKWTDRKANTKSRYVALSGPLATAIMDRVGATMDEVEED